MPGSTGRDLYLDKALSNMAMGYRPEGFIADMIFPQVSVGKQSGIYYEFSRADRLRRENTHRSPGTPAKRVTESVSSGTYFANNYALASPVTIEDKANADPILVSELLNGKSTYILDKLLLDWEYRVANQVTSGSNVGSYVAVASAWNVDSGSDPLGDMNTAIDNVKYANGVKPNRVVFGEEAWDTFRRHPQVRDIIFGNNNGGGYPNTAQVADLIGVENVMVAGAFQNTGEEGLTESLSTVWGDNVLIYYAPGSPSIQTPSFGYSLRWAAPGLPNMQVERHPYDSITKSELVEVGYYQDEKLTGASYGFLILAVDSST